MRSIRDSDAAARSRRWGKRSRRFSRSAAGSRKRVEATSGTCGGSCSDGWRPYKPRRGDPETALSTIDEAFRHINDVAGRAWEAELRRLRGDILLAARPEAVGDAERSYRDAIAVAQRQRARSLELRAATALARLLQGQGRSAEALEVLAPIYGWFTEGLDTADLRAAKTLLDELESPPPPQRAVKPSTRPRR